MKNNNIPETMAINNLNRSYLGASRARGSYPPQSGNPQGRPRTRGLLGTLRVKVAEVGPDGRTVEERIVNVLLQEALHGRHRLAAVETIFDRLEGRPKQHLDLADVTQELRQKTDAELLFHLAHDRWPDANELLELNSQPNEQAEE